jgi:hypothetical protein
MASLPGSVLGLLKVEMEGTVAVALCPKTYIVHNADLADSEDPKESNKATQLSSKGVSKRSNRLMVKHYL